MRMLNKSKVAGELVKLAKILLAEEDGFGDANMEELVEALKKLKKNNSSKYEDLMEDYRDVLPHSGKQDVMLGNLEKFKRWMGKSPEDAEAMLKEVQKVLRVGSMRKAGFVDESYDKHVNMMGADNKTIVCSLNFTVDLGEFDLKMFEKVESDINKMKKAEYENLKKELSDEQILVKKVNPNSGVSYRIEGYQIDARTAFTFSFSDGKAGIKAYEKLTSDFGYGK